MVSSVTSRSLSEKTEVELTKSTFLISDFSINGRMFSILETKFSEEFPLNLGGILIIKTWLCSKN
jgi:hypothetical protein